MANRGCNTCANNAGLEHVLHCWVALLVFLLWLPAAAASTTRLEQQGSFPLNFDTSLYYMGVDGLVPRDASMPHASKRRELKQQAIGGGGAKISTQPAEEFDPFAPQIPVNLTSLLAPEEKIDIWLLLGKRLTATYRSV